MRFLPLVLLLVLISPLAAQTDNRNAATWYGRAFQSIDRLTQSERDLIDAYRDDPSGAPSPELRAALSKAEVVMGMAERGARQRFSDYQLDYDEGYGLMLPHLGQSRYVARLMQADAYLKLHDGDTRGAAERVASMYRMAEHAGHDRIVISSLVGLAIWHAGDKVLQSALDRGQVTADEAAIMLEAAGDLPENDPFNYVDAVLREADFAIASVQRHVYEEDGGLEALVGFVATEDQVPPELALMTDEDLQNEMESYTALMSEMSEAFAANDEARVAQMEQDLLDGKYGVLVKIIMPAMTLSLERKIQTEQQIQARIQTLSALVAGDVDPLEQANAALWYLRAAALLEKLLEDKGDLRDALREAEAPGADTTAEMLQRFLADDTGEVFKVLAGAARMKRCDFSYARGRRDRGPVFVPPYAAELREVLRLVIVDATRRLQARDHDGAVDRLQLLWSMLDHFERDAMFATAIMSHQAFGRAATMTLDVMRREGVSEGQRVMLVALAGQVSRVDPFGYVASVVKAREALGQYYGRAIPYDTKNRKELSERLKLEAKQLDGERLLFIGVIMDTMRRADLPEAERRDPDLARLDDVFDMDAVAIARRQVPEVAPLLLGYRITEIEPQAAPEIGRIASRTRDAQRDLRTTIRTLREITEESERRSANSEPGVRAGDDDPLPPDR
ncbi:MAG: hypothetical protein ACYTGC_04745 [Planctomycetota bacterium]|jgi:hypothetical protein